MRLAVALILSCSLSPAFAQLAKTDIAGPVGSDDFGRHVHVLANGNIVVSDPTFDAPGPIVDVGAVYLYTPTGTLISTLTGSQAGDQVGVGGSNGSIVELANGHFVVVSPLWDNGAAFNAGAVTWVNGHTGLNGTVSAANSIVGSQPNDRVGAFGTVALTNGHYVVRSDDWNNGSISKAGAATWGNGQGGTVGPVSAANSLVGSSTDDQVGFQGIVALANGHYVVGSLRWDNGSTQNAGAATWGNGETGTSGTISASNSLIGLTPGDAVGGQIEALANGHYAVITPFWDNGADADTGAVRWCDGASGCVGVLTAANALIGSHANDRIGNYGARTLASGHFVLRSPFWFDNRGAATWISGDGPTVGAVSAANSLVGSQVDDQVAGDCLIALANDHYVVCSSGWDNGATANVGAVTWGNGATGTSGVVSSANSLIGANPDDRVGYVTGCAAKALSNGHYVVCSPAWDHGAIADVGAVTWVNGQSATSAVVSTTNSLVGSTLSDGVGRQVLALDNGHYIVMSPMWDYVPSGWLNAGAITWRNGSLNSSGVVDFANSRYGLTTDNRIGSQGGFSLPGGKYVVLSPFWDTTTPAERGAATWGDGAAVSNGLIGAANSLVGTRANDNVGNEDGADVDNQRFLFGYYLIKTTSYDGAVNVNTGAVTIGKPDGTTVGEINSSHSLIGDDVTGPGGLDVAHNGIGLLAAVGQSRVNRVTLLRPGTATSVTLVSATPDPSAGGQEVTVSVLVVANPAPVNGSVRIMANSGDAQCTDPSPTVVNATTMSYSCSLTFTTPGSRQLRAEFLGSATHAYSVSAPEPHTVVVDPVFKDGFETSPP
jgi:hypothetical protein